jgi:sterol desaturase/sphingolipid hydroxylase (fatty acid hydroxylase superfamily)
MMGDDLGHAYRWLIDAAAQHESILANHLQGVLLSASLIALFTIAELRRPAGRLGGVRERATNILIGLIVSVFAFICAVIVAWFAPLVWPDGIIGLVVAGWRGEGLAGLAISVIAYGVVWDFFQYWFHRWQHVTPRLWPTHRVHHSDRTISTTTALRRSVVELFLIFFFVAVPTIVVAGVNTAAAPIAFAIFYGWGFFNHANIRLSLGPLTPVFSGPHWHRLHHAVDLEYRDKNFAAYFPILDILFGTYRPPPRCAYPESGVADAAAVARPLRDCLLARAE